MSEDTYLYTRELLARYPLATVISVDQEVPFVSHLPLIADETSPQTLRLLGHLARRNPQAKVLDGRLVTAVVHGPHAYVTPAWYVEDDVPTWNYSLVHLRGRVQFFHDHAATLRCLRELSERMENLWPSGWQFYLPADLKDPSALIASIAAFSLEVTEVHVKRKLSQGKAAADRAGVMRGLQARGDEQSQGVWLEMKALFSEDGENQDG